MLFDSTIYVISFKMIFATVYAIKTAKNGKNMLFFNARPAACDICIMVNELPSADVMIPAWRTGQSDGSTPVIAFYG